MTAKENNKLHVYLLAGVKTSTSIFTACMNKLSDRLSADGVEATIDVLLPYGDMSRNLVRQLIEVRSDLSNGRLARRIGGKYAFSKIKSSLPEGRRLLLIGHSGGGAAAYQAARMLDVECKQTDFRIVQIGSPRIPILPKLQQKVSYFHAVDQSGKGIDPICRLGSWGGWNKGEHHMIRWNARKYSPGHVEGVPTMGGHADYFRNEHPFIDQNAICNLDKIMGRVHEWLKGWL